MIVNTGSGVLKAINCPAFTTVTNSTPIAYWREKNFVTENTRNKKYERHYRRHKGTLHSQ